MNIDLRYPNITAQDEKGQLTQMKSYLHQLVEQLQWALNTVDAQPTSTAVASARTGEANSESSGAIDRAATFNAIKSLIITSADIVEAYYEEINKKLSGLYVAESDFGTFVEETNAKFSATSTHIEQKYEDTQTVIGGLASELGGVSTELGGVKESVDSLSGSYTHVSTQIESVSGALTNVSGKVDSVSGRVDTVSGEITEVSNRVTSVSSDLSGVSGRVEEVSGRVESVNTDLSGKFESVSGEVSEVSGRVDTVSGELSTVSGRVDGVASNVEQVSGELGETKNELTKVSDDVTGLDKTLANTQNALGDLSKDLGDIQEAKDKISGDLSGVSDMVGTMSGNLDDLSKDLGDVNGKVDGVSDRLGNSEKELSDVQVFVKTTKANIKSGLLYYVDEEGNESMDAGTPVYGFMVGQENIVNGETKFKKYARFISNRLSFYDENDQEVAYISDRKLYITDVEVTGSYKIGGLRDYVTPRGSVVTKWIGA